MPKSWKRNLPDAIKILTRKIEEAGIPKFNYLNLIEPDVEIQAVKKSLLPGRRDKDAVVLLTDCIPGSVITEMPAKVESPADIAKPIIFSILKFKDNVCSKCPVILKVLMGL